MQLVFVRHRPFVVTRCPLKIYVLNFLLKNTRLIITIFGWKHLWEWRNINLETYDYTTGAK